MHKMCRSFIFLVAVNVFYYTYYQEGSLLRQDIKKNKSQLIAWKVIPAWMRQTADNTYWRCRWNLTHIIGVYSGTW